jgi:threonine aldolase
MVEQMPIDLRSDYVARPTPAMIDVLAAALRQQPAFGLREDLRQRELESFAAGLLGKEDALLFPTCAMANQVAILLFCRPGDTLVAEETSHVITSEAGAPAALAGALSRPLRGDHGQIDLDELAGLLAAPVDELRSKVALIVIENTHTRSGGAVLPVAYHAAVAAIAGRHGVPVHLDGARLFNAAVALKGPVTDLTRDVTTVSVSLNKGLCAPFGALLAGSASLIAEALRFRQMLGGGLRGTGFVAAAGLEALRMMIPRLAEDHRHAAQVAAGLAGLAGLRIVAPEPITNILILELSPALGTAQDFLAALAARHVLASPFDRQRLRFVFHRDIDDRAVTQLVQAVGDIVMAQTVRSDDL